MGASEQKVMMAALSVALRAQVNALIARDVLGLVVLAGEKLPKDAPLARAVNDFAAAYREVRRDPAALEAIGARLRRVVEVESLPNPPDLGRVDIHG